MFVVGVVVGVGDDWVGDGGEGCGGGGEAVATALSTDHYVLVVVRRHDARRATVVLAAGSVDGVSSADGSEPMRLEINKGGYIGIH